MNIVEMKNKIFISYKIDNFAAYLQLIFPIKLF